MSATTANKQRRHDANMYLAGVGYSWEYRRCTWL
jgi:hypothetical protein